MSLDTTINLVSLNDLKAYLGELSKTNAIWIYSDGASATAATVEVTDTTMVLTITGGGDAGANTLTFADADTNTMTELITKINALSGWKSGLICHPDEDSSNLIVTGALSCNTSANEITLLCVDEYNLNEWINRASRAIERYCNRKLKSRTYTREQYWGSGYDRLILEQYPATQVLRVAEGRTSAFSIRNTSSDMNWATVEITSTTMELIVDGGTNDDDTTLTLTSYTSIDALITAIEALSKGWSCTAISSETDTRDADELLIRPGMYVDSNAQAYCEIPNDYLTDFRLEKPSEDRNEGVLYYTGGFTAGIEFFITYLAGYTTIPYDLELFCFELIKYKIDQKETDAGMRSERKGDYAYERFSPVDINAVFFANPELKHGVDLFKKRVI